MSTKELEQYKYSDEMFDDALRHYSVEDQWCGLPFAYALRHKFGVNVSLYSIIRRGICGGYERTFYIVFCVFLS